MDILLFIKIIALAYFVAVNVYGYILIKNQNKKLSDLISASEKTKNSESSQNQKEEKSEFIQPKKQRKTRVNDGKVLMSGLLGGAIGIYAGMFKYKYKLTNFLLMVIIPVFIAINLYLLISAFFSGFWIITQSGG